VWRITQLRDKGCQVSYGTGCAGSVWVPPYSEGTGDPRQVQAAVFPADAASVGILGVPSHFLPGEEKSFVLKRICFKIEGAEAVASHNSGKCLCTDARSLLHRITGW